MCGVVLLILRLLRLLGLCRSLARLLLGLLSLVALLRCLVVGVRFTWALGVGGGGLIVGYLGAVSGLLSLLGLLCALLARNLLCTR
ncbi:hypothetical protein BKG81_02645 [Mycobacteroides chelonae]|nr:hypothetical protein BKG81_02645 [Mycobacteroides chelonae]